MPGRYGAKFDEMLSECFSRIVFWEEDDFNEEETVAYIHSCANLLKGRPIVRTLIMESFSKGVALWCFNKCGWDAIIECDLSMKESYYLDWIIRDFRGYIFEMSWSGEGYLCAAIHEYDTSVLGFIIDNYWEAFEFPIWTRECNDIGMGDTALRLIDMWKDNVARDFMMHWFSFDFPAYLPFLKEPNVNKK
jgi:hypothetical protein